MFTSLLCCLCSRMIKDDDKPLNEKSKKLLSRLPYQLKVSKIIKSYLIQNKKKLKVMSLENIYNHILSLFSSSLPLEPRLTDEDKKIVIIELIQLYIFK